MKQKLIILCTTILCLSGNAWSSKEQYCMTEAIYYEARAESYIGKIAVGHVILNRIRKGYGSNPCDVVSKKRQFSWFGKRIPIKEYKLWNDCDRISADILDNKTKDPTKGSIFFHERRLKPRWKYKRTVAIGSHIFYK